MSSGRGAKALLFAVAVMAGLLMAGGALAATITLGDPSGEDQVGSSSAWEVSIPMSWDESGCVSTASAPDPALYAPFPFTPGTWSKFWGPGLFISPSRPVLQALLGDTGETPTLAGEAFPLVSMSGPLTASTFSQAPAPFRPISFARTAPAVGSGVFYAAGFICPNGNWTGHLPDMGVTTSIHVLCHDESEGPGGGYDELAPALKTKLTALYAVLAGEDACYKFSSGSRTQTKQSQLWTRWHAIADSHPGDSQTPSQLCQALEGAGFAQLPTGMRVPKGKTCAAVSGTPQYDSTGEAKGGPAWVSAHTSGEAADIGVVFSDSDWKPNWSELVAAVHQVPGLCPPPSTDKVHVFLPNASGVCKF